MTDSASPQQYVTLAGPAESRLEVKKSIFIAWARPAGNGQEAEAVLAEARAAFPDARHHVSAWRTGTGTEQKLERYSDDGEPSGTAGQPVLNILKGQNLENACLVVTRYFGGTLLGTGGLVHAYGSAAAQAVSLAGRKRMALSRRWQLSLPYSLYTPCTRLCESRGWRILDSQFLETVSLETAVPQNESETFLAAIRDLTQGSVNPAEMDLAYYPFDDLPLEEK